MGVVLWIDLDVEVDTGIFVVEEKLVAVMLYIISFLRLIYIEGSFIFAIKSTS